MFVCSGPKNENIPKFSTFDENFKKSPAPTSVFRLFSFEPSLLVDDAVVGRHTLMQDILRRAFSWIDSKTALESVMQNAPIRDERPHKTEIWMQGAFEHRLDGPAYTRYRADGSIEIERWSRYGRRHRDDGPAEIQYRDDGSVLVERWFRRGVSHRDGGPAETFFNEDGSVHFAHWRKDGVDHRDDGPASIVNHRDGSPDQRTWFQNGKEHRDGGPAWISYYGYDHLFVEKWYHHGVPHRVGGPAVCFYDVDGLLDTEVWYQFGVRHREDGPAYISRSFRLGALPALFECFVHGKKLQKESMWWMIYADQANNRILRLCL